MTMIVSGSTGLEFPDGSDQATAFTGNASTITSGTLDAARLPSSGVNAASITVGTVATARLATGTANSSTYLRGDQTWAAVPAATPGGSTTQVQYNNAGAFGGDSGFVYTGGNVGIGTSSPGTKLDINSGSNTSAITLQSTSTNIYTKLINSSGTSYIGAAGLNLVFEPNGTERMRIDSSGNVGIGISPTDTGGFGRAVDAYSATGAAYYARSSSGVMDFGLSGTSGYVWNRTNGSIQFATNNTERMRITSTGDLQFNSGYGSVATAYGVRAWVNFNGTGTVAIRASGNVSSVSDGGTGNYTVNLSSAMPDSNFAVVVGGRRDTGGSQFDQNTGGYATSTSAASVRTADEGPSAVDFQFVSVAIIR